MDRDKEVLQQATAVVDVEQKSHGKYCQMQACCVNKFILSTATEAEICFFCWCITEFFRVGIPLVVLLLGFDTIVQTGIDYQISDGSNKANDHEQNYES